VVERLQTQMQTGENIYDAYVNDSDLIGTHWRYQQVRNLTDWMAGEGADVTNPNLNLDDFIGLQFTTGPDGLLYQLPDQQFANLYWFRYDWFTDPEKNMADFEAEYGYPLGVPVNWSAYEDIAEFFTGREIAYGSEGRLWSHGLRASRSLAGLALHRRVDVDGRHGRRG
jgi:glycerol transport system substrate-binding protein